MSTSRRGKVTLDGQYKRLVVDVRPEHIAKGERRKSAHCMIKLAIQASAPTARFVSVDLSTCRFTDPATHRRYVYLTPRAAQLALINFDDGVWPEPFRFVLHRPVCVLESGTQPLPRGGNRPASTKRQGTTRGREVGTLRPDGKSDTRERASRKTHVPIVLGGKAPPTGALASPPRREPTPKPGQNPALRQGRGMVRKFGIRQLRE